jgi:hypothetical protein
MCHYMLCNIVLLNDTSFKLASLTVNSLKTGIEKDNYF